MSAFILLGLPSLAVARNDLDERGPATSWHRDAIDGVRGALADPVVRAMMIGFAAFVAFAGMDDVVLVFLGRQNLHAGSAGIALIYAGSGVGLFFGFLFVARLRRWAPSALFVSGLALAGAANVATGLAWATYAAFLMQVGRGLGVSAIDVGSSTLLQRAVPADRLGRAFANLYGVIGLAAGVSYLAGGALLHVASPRLVLVIAGGGGVGAAIWTASVAPGRPLRSNRGHAE